MIQESQLILAVAERVSMQYDVVVLVQHCIASHIEDELNHQEEEFISLLRESLSDIDARGDVHITHEMWTKEDLDFLIKIAHCEKSRMLFIVDRHSHKSIGCLQQEECHILQLPLNLNALII